MSRKRIRAKTCLECKRIFFGTIDLSGIFCTVQCKIAHGPLPEKKTLPISPHRLLEIQRIEHAIEISNLNKQIGKMKRSQRKNSRKKNKLIKQRGFHPFFDSPEWMNLRYQAIRLYGRRCMACGRTEGEIHVDHIKPRSKYPHLTLDMSNLQILCRGCNMAKGNTDEIDWRPHAAAKTRRMG